MVFKDWITSAQFYIHPTILRTYPHDGFSEASSCCWSDELDELYVGHSVEKS